MLQLGLQALALGAELPSDLPGPTLITRLGRAQRPSVTPARFMTMRDPGEVTAPGWWQAQSPQLPAPRMALGPAATPQALRSMLRAGEDLEGAVW